MSNDNVETTPEVIARDLTIKALEHQYLFGDRTNEGNATIIANFYNTILKGIKNNN